MDSEQRVKKRYRLLRDSEKIGDKNEYSAPTLDDLNEQDAVKPLIPEEEHFEDAIKLYLREIQKTKLLTVEEEKELALKVSSGDMAARERMIVANLRLVVKIAKRYMNRGMPFVDLIEEGNVGLIKAIERFKLSRNCRLSTYATWWIRQSIERALVNQVRTIRLPVHVADQIYKMFKVTRELIHKLNREPSIREVAEGLEAPPAQVRRLMILLKRTYSIERPMGEMGDYYLTDILQDTTTMPPSELLENLSCYDLVTRMFESLTESERKILTLRFGLNDTPPQTLDAIGRIFGVTRERIRQIEVKSIEKLRNLVVQPADDPGTEQT